MYLAGKDVPKPVQGQIPAASMKLAEIAERIDAHLKRIEADPKTNPWNDGKVNGTRPYFRAGVHTSGSRIASGTSAIKAQRILTKMIAIKYLAWLDAGNVGKHFVLERQRSATCSSTRCRHCQGSRCSWTTTFACGCSDRRGDLQLPELRSCSLGAAARYRMLRQRHV